MGAFSLLLLSWYCAEPESLTCGGRKSLASVLGSHKMRYMTEVWLGFFNTSYTLDMLDAIRIEKPPFFDRTHWKLEKFPGFSEESELLKEIFRARTAWGMPSPLRFLVDSRFEQSNSIIIG